MTQRLPSLPSARRAAARAFPFPARGRPSAWALLLLGLSLALPGAALHAQQDGSVTAATKISANSGGFGGALQFEDFFGIAVTAIGDLDGDGVSELAVGAVGDDDGSINPSQKDLGGVWILFMNADGSVKTQSKISHTEGDLGPVLASDDWFGYGVEQLGDFDGDGVFDLAVGASGDKDAAWSAGALYLLMLEPDGSVKSHTKITEGQGGFTGQLGPSDDFANTIANLGDLDGDGTLDLAVGSAFDDDGGFNSGAVWILFLAPDGSVKSHTKISNLSHPPAQTLDSQDEFGRCVANLGDLDGDGVNELAVGAYGDDDGFNQAGSVWILFLNADGSPERSQKISATTGGFSGTLDAGARFGSALAPLGDLNGDGVPDLAVGASRGPFFDPGPSRCFVLFLRGDGTVKSQLEIGDGQAGFPFPLVDGDRFGESLANLGDLDGDGVMELAVGANGDDDGAPDAGALYVLSLAGETNAHWTTLTPGKPAGMGSPHLSADAALSPGARGELELTRGPSGAHCWFVLGLSPLDAPFKGGVFYPNADIVLPPVLLDSSGHFELPIQWPPGAPGGFSFWLQAWIADISMPGGFSATNGLMGTSHI